VGRAFQGASAARAELDVRNLLVLGRLSREAAGPSNLAVGPSAFVNVEAHDYALEEASPAIDAGVTIPEVATDITGAQRPHGRGYDIGAYEYPSRASSGRTRPSTRSPGAFARAAPPARP
jgi:hypothetical protein